MKKTRWMLYAIFGLVFYLLFIIIETPASWFAWGLNRYTQGSVRLDPLAGSLWSGNGRLVIYYPKTTPHDFGQAEWSINPLWLLTGHIQLSLQTNAQDKQIKIMLGIARNSFILKEAEAVFPASFISQIHPPASLISPQGKVSITGSELILGKENMKGTAVLEWRNAGSGLSNVQPLGDYRLDIIGAGETANLKLATLRGDLELTGQGRWLPAKNQIMMTGSATAKGNAQELEPLMQLLGNDMGSGRRSFSIALRLPP